MLTRNANTCQNSKGKDYVERKRKQVNTSAQVITREEYISQAKNAKVDTTSRTKTVKTGKGKAIAPKVSRKLVMI
jgi:hypothetical protein